MVSNTVGKSRKRKIKEVIIGFGYMEIINYLDRRHFHEMVRRVVQRRKIEHKIRKQGPTRATLVFGLLA